MAKISVVIPCYNHAHFLELAVKSVTNQTYHDYEITIINDGSTDNTHEVAARLLSSNIKCVFQNNRGLSAARNTGISHSSGDYLVFLDADDELETTFFERCLHEISNDPSAMLAGVYCLGFFIDEEGNTLPSLAGSNVVPPPEFRNRIVEGRLHPVHAAMLHRRIINELGGFDHTLTSLEDWDYWLRISARYTMRGISEPLVRYRIVPDSMSSDADRINNNRIRVLCKHFGPLDGDVKNWATEKRKAYGYGYKRSALMYMANDRENTGWQLLEAACAFWPALISSIETYYEIACITQPRGLHGEVGTIDLIARETHMTAWLKDYFQRSSLDVKSIQGRAFGNMYVSLAMISDQKGDWARARHYLLRAIACEPALGRDPSILRRLMKLAIGQSRIQWIKHLISNT